MATTGSGASRSQLRARRVPGPDGSVNSTAFGPSGSAVQPTGTGTTKPLGSYHQVRPAGSGLPSGGARFGPARSAVPTSAAGGAAALRDAAGARCNWVATATPAGAPGGGAARPPPPPPPPPPPGARRPPRAGHTAAR